LIHGKLKAVENERFFQIRVGTILPDRPIPFDLYVLLRGKHIHYLREGQSLTLDKIKSLDRGNVFYIRESHRQFYKNFIFDRLNEESLEAGVKASILRESSMTLAEEIFEKSDVSEALTESKVLITQFIDFMEQEPEGMAHLISLSSHDFYTYNHSLDVSIYSLGLGSASGYSREQLIELGRGSLFHDIGKRNVAVEIICKQGPLNDVEWAQMQKHPQFGLKILTENGASEDVKACCFEHHENFLGNGYPQQLPGEEIHHMARIVAITDTFDALTTKRSYNEPRTPIDALEFMSAKLANRYDPDLLKAMHSVLFKLKKVG